MKKPISPFKKTPHSSFSFDPTQTPGSCQRLIHAWDSQNSEFDIRLIWRAPTTGRSRLLNRVTSSFRSFISRGFLKPKEDKKNKNM